MAGAGVGEFTIGGRVGIAIAVGGNDVAVGTAGGRAAVGGVRRTSSAMMFGSKAVCTAGTVACTVVGEGLIGTGDAEPQPVSINIEPIDMKNRRSWRIVMRYLSEGCGQTSTGW
jgi:hypothetical protein